MKLDPILAPFLANHVFEFTGDVVAERAKEREFGKTLVGTVIRPMPDSVHTQDEMIGGPDPLNPVRVRIYTPTGNKKRAALVYAHGGGWSTGSIETAQHYCGTLAADADVVVISVEYRLAPENPFPAGIEDYYHAILWSFTNAERFGVDPTRIAVGGGSAGGNLAAVACLMARDRKGPKIAFQLLEVPVLDVTIDPKLIEEMRGALPALAESGHLIAARYATSPELAKNPYISPLLAQDLSGLPPALCLACEVDLVRDDCERYAKRLIEAGGEATWRVYPGLLHGTQELTLLLPSAKEWHDECVAAMKSL
jgi:acetyl esterase